MRLGAFVKFYLLTAGALLLAFSLYPLSTIKMALIFLGYTFISPYCFKLYLGQRGVGRGDTVLVTLESKNSLTRGFSIEKLPGRALTSGRVGDVVDIEFMGKKASAEVASSGGLIFPPEVRVLFYEESPAKEV